MTHDDLTPWQDSPFVHALTSDGTAAELAGEEAAVAAFNTTMPARRRHRMVRFVGTGVTSVALVGAVGGGVAAAAFTRSLPEPVQSAIHDVFGPIGVPAPHKHHTQASKPSVTTVAAPTSAPAVTPTSTPPPASPTANPLANPAPTPSKHPSPVAVLPTISAGAAPSASASPQSSATPTASAAPSPSPVGPAGDPSTWSVTAQVSSRDVRVHDDVDVSGTLVDADGQPVADHRVVVRVHIAGTSGWQQEAVRRTGSDGSISDLLSDLRQNTVVVLGAGHGVHSSAVRIVVRPQLSVSSSPSADGTSYLVGVTADGGEAGDAVSIVKHTSDGWVVVSQSQLDANASATFSVPAPTHPRWYVVRLSATKEHGPASDRFMLQPLS